MSTPKCTPVSIPNGYCQCGCGRQTKIAPSTMPKRGWIKGQPIRFIHGHNPIRRNPESVFWSRVDKTGGEDACWLWLGALTHGYGSFRWNGKSRHAHHVAYVLTYGEYDDDLELMHECDNPACVNPKHLTPATHQDNMADMKAKGRSNGARGENSGRHKLTDQQVEEIRMRYRTESISQTQLARDYGVSSHHVSLIVRFLTRA